MTRKPTTKQKLLAFDGAKELRRQERVERLLRVAPEQITTGARMFDEQAFQEATRLARQAVEKSSK